MTLKHHTTHQNDYFTQTYMGKKTHTHTHARQPTNQPTNQPTPYCARTERFFTARTRDALHCPNPRASTHTLQQCGSGDPSVAAGVRQPVAPGLDGTTSAHQCHNWHLRQAKSSHRHNGVEQPARFNRYYRGIDLLLL